MEVWFYLLRCAVCNHCQVNQIVDLKGENYWRVKALEERFLRILTPGRRTIARGNGKAAIEYEYEG